MPRWPIPRASCGAGVHGVRGSGLVVVELLEHLLHVGELLLGLLDRLLELLQALLLGDLLVALCVLLEAVVLDLLARVLDLAEAERGGRALEEVAEFGERLEVLLFAGGGVSAGRARRERVEAGSQVGVHLLKGALGLCEEVIDDALGELAVVVVVHLEDLLERVLVDAVLGAGDGHDAVLALLVN